MVRLLLKVALLPPLLLTAWVLLARARPYDDGDLHAFLTPTDSCPSPCFMDIRPGFTTFNDAWIILENHAWVQDLRLYQDELSQTYLYFRWQWSGQQPPHLIGTGYAFIQGTAADDIIGSIQVTTNLAFGQIVLAFGQPEQVGSNRNDRTASYPRVNLLALNSLRCLDFWRAPSTTLILVSPERAAQLGVATGLYPPGSASFNRVRREAITACPRW